MLNDIIDNLKKGKVVAIKTDTVYGLICDATNIKAVAKIYDIKKREKKKPLSIFLRSVDDVEKYVDTKNLTKRVINIMNKYWPGALTIIFKKKNNDLDHLLNGKDGIAIRIPKDITLLKILSNVDFPLAETSCNISGEVPCIDASEINNKFGNMIDLIVDGGRVINNKPSTVISVESNEPFILRLGDINIEAEC